MSESPTIQVVSVVIFVFQLPSVSVAFDQSLRKSSDKKLETESLHGKVLSWVQTSISLDSPFRQPGMASATASLTAGLTPQQLEVLKNQNHDTEVYALAAVFSILAIFAVIVRVTSRHMKKVAVGIDDVLVFIALVRHWHPQVWNKTLLLPRTKADIISR